MAAKAKQADVEEQEEDDKPEGENEQPAAKSKFAFLKFKMPSMKWMVIGGAGLLVLVGGGGGAYFFLKGSAHKEPQVAAKPATFVDLPDVGIKGNSHMMMMDRNSDQVADLIQKWLVGKGLTE